MPNSVANYVVFLRRDLVLFDGATDSILDANPLFYCTERGNNWSKTELSKVPPQECIRV